MKFCFFFSCISKFTFSLCLFYYKKYREENTCPANRQKLMLNITNLMKMHIGANICNLLIMLPPAYKKCWRGCREKVKGKLYKVDGMEISIAIMKDNTDTGHLSLLSKAISRVLDRNWRSQEWEWTCAHIQCWCLQMDYHSIEQPCQSHKYHILLNSFVFHSQNSVDWITYKKTKIYFLVAN